MNKTNAEYSDLTSRPIGALLWQYALPAIIAMMTSSLYNIIDGIFIGQGVGADAITGLALTNPLMALSAAFGAMVGVGGATLMSVRLGQQDHKAARHILGNVVVLNIFTGLLLMVGALAFLEPILRAFGASDATLPYAADFLRIILMGNVITHLFYGLNAQLRSTHRPRLAMAATIGSVAINSVLAALFIFGLGWGIRGAALATVLAQASMLVWQLRLFSNANDLVHLSRRYLRPRWRIIRETITIGMPQLLLNSCAALVGIIITRSMASFGGDTAVGAFGIVGRLMMLVVFVVIGFNQGMQPIAGYNFGAGRNDRVIAVARMTIMAATLITTLGFIVTWIWAEPLVSIFAKDAPELIEASARGLRIAFGVFPFVGMQIVSSAFFQSIGIPGKSIFLSLTRQVIFLIPALLVLPRLWHDPVEGIWLAMPLSDAAASLLSAFLLWRQFKALQQPSTL